MLVTLVVFEKESLWSILQLQGSIERCTAAIFRTVLLFCALLLVCCGYFRDFVQGLVVWLEDGGVGA